MLKYSNEWENPNNVRWFTELHKDGIPLEYRPIYYPLRNKIIGYYKSLIRDIINCSTDEISMPMGVDLFEKYLTGWKIEYVGFDGDIGGRSGYWEFDEENEDTVIIYYNLNDTKKRQRFTQIHETFHFIQWLDPRFCEFFDYIIINELLPNKLILHLLEKATDKATAIYLMPNNFFGKKWREVKSIKEMSDYFQVSEQSIAYRLKECQII